ncbi:MAG: thioredoxin family protein [Gemmatimonadales bacterium]
MDDQSLRERFAAGSTFRELLARRKDNSELWEAIYKRATLCDEALARVRAIRSPWNFLVVNEDWCGDSVNILPYVARLKEASPYIEMRILGRDTNRDLMDAHLTGTSRSIPIVIVLDEHFHEKGWWGPRPGPLQQWVTTEGLALPRPERYPLIRAWYARDRGRTIVSEILSITEGSNG